MARRTIRELSKPLFGLNADKSKKDAWMRRGGKRRIRRMERHQAKKEIKDGDE